MHPEWKHLTSSDLNLDEDECLCMLIKLSNVLRGPLDKWQSTLNGNEIAAADRFRNSHDRNRYIASRYLLTSFLELVFKKKPLIFPNKNGKPLLAASTGYFNLSHAGEYLLMAFSHQPVGVDIEKIIYFSEMEFIKNNFYHPGEISEINQAPIECSVKRFFTCWTRKEALLKAMGCGLSIKTESFRVSCIPNRPALIQGPDPNNNHWVIFNLPEIDSAYSASICLHNEPKNIKYRLVNL